MAKFINKKEEVIQMQLTAYGKHKFSKGEFKPSFYSFYDDDIIYDAVYSSPSGAADHGSQGFNEEQNNVVTRVKNSQRIELLTHFTSSMGGSSEATTNITNTDFDNVTEGNLKFFRPIGASSPWKDYKPSWDIKCMETGTPFSGTISYKGLGIPTLTSSLKLEYTVRTTPSVNQDGQEYDLSIYDLERSDKILIDITELNTVFKANGNFDVEVYKIVTEEEGNERLEKLSFIDDRSTYGAHLRNQTSLEKFASVLNGDEELIERNFPKLGPEFVEYYLSVRADDEIEEDIIKRGGSLYKSGKVVGPEEC